MASGDVTIAQDGGGNAKLHPYLVTLVRWCVSCLWSTASLFLHRLITSPLPSITASKPLPRPASKPRQAGTDHLHPEPKVECVVLHTPEVPTLDVIFVHGLYGSLGNTWRQGDWSTKYKLDPKKVPLRNHASQPCNCHAKQEQSYENIHFTYETNLNENETVINETVSFKQINGCFKKILPNENSLITEKFYNNTFLNVNVSNYETQAKFVSELFKTDCKQTCDLDTFKCNLDANVNKCNCKNKCKCKLNECECKINENKLNKCEIGCGCVCDECYSSCWPKDWIKEDFPGARVISINYTSDPYLWRPLWIKGNKRLRLHERADQMMEQLLELGVGDRPIIWVGHSKGGLFIKQIFCDAYDAHMKINDSINNINNADQSNNSNNVDNNYEFNKNIIEDRINERNKIENVPNINDFTNNNIADTLKGKFKNINEKDKNFNFVKFTEDENTEICACVGNDAVLDNKQARYDTEYMDISLDMDEDVPDEESGDETDDEKKVVVMSSNNEEDILTLESRASLWRQSAGFMFYSVPHRGSPLADIKTPITARSIELLEISKDCQLVLDLQSRWLVAAGSSRPQVRSLVETCRTLMSVLWLRIVSVDSADAGIGSLHGVSVDHREICKPSSRRCLLYTELTTLIENALMKCKCRTNDQLRKYV